MLIARLIAEPETLGDTLGDAMAQIEETGWEQPIEAVNRDVLR